MSNQNNPKDIDALIQKHYKYWKDREDEALKHYITEEAEYSKEIQKIYSNMLAASTKEIEAFYGKYATKEGITLAEAKKRIRKADIAAYEAKAAKYVKDKDFSAKANEEMRLYNAMMKINRLEMLKANIGLEMIAGHDELDKFMQGILKGRTMEELERQAGILGKTVFNNAKTAHAIVNSSFKNATFSDRIWQYQDLMRDDLDRLLQQGLIGGKNARALTKDLRQYLIGDKQGKGATYNVERLMRTELARVQTEAQKQSFERNGFKFYRFIHNEGYTKAGNTACDICRAVSSKDSGFGEGVYKVEDMKPGLNAPPMHPLCRCSTAAYSDQKEYEEWLEYLANGGTTAEYNAMKNGTPCRSRKKKYLTKKVLEENLAEIAKEKEALKNKYAGQDITKAGSAGDQKRWAELLELEKDYTEKLNKKITAAEVKKLKKEQLALQEQLDGFEVKTYSNIWKYDVETIDWDEKQGAIAAKKQYFEQQLLYATTDAEKAKWNALLDALDDFNTQGQAYYGIKEKLNVVNNDLQRLLNGAKVGADPGDAFSKARKDAAKWFDRAHGGFKKADAYFDPPSKKIHNGASRSEQDGFYTYTQSSGGHNRPLAGFQKPFYDSTYGYSGWEAGYFKGAKKVWIDYEGKGEQIRGLTKLIQKSTYDDDVWLQSGQGFATVEGFLGIPYGSLEKMTDNELSQFIGRRNKIYSFISTAVNEGGGSMFNAKPLKINFYAPKGTQMLYASDVGAFGKGENEMILQRGGTYEITRIYWGVDKTDGGTRKIFVDMDIHPEAGYDLFQQDPNEWTGSRNNYRD